jgi:hypothetical protein
MSGDIDLRGLSATAGQPALLIVEDDHELRELVPYPSSQASQVPPCAGPLGAFWPITPAVADHDAPLGETEP